MHLKFRGACIPQRNRTSFGLSPVRVSRVQSTNRPRAPRDPLLFTVITAKPLRASLTSARAALLQRSYTTQPATMPVEVEYSAGEDAKQMAEQLKPLLAENGGRWTLTEDGKGLERDVKFKTFKTTWVSPSISCSAPISSPMKTVDGLQGIYECRCGAVQSHAASPRMVQRKMTIPIA